jgi:DNA-binding PadR family transcriptional regulator
VTPYELEILIHYRCSVIEFARSRAPAFEPTMRGLESDGLVKRVDGGLRGYEMTDKGVFYVDEGLCRVPLPIHRWEIPSATKGE